jgi:GTPase SAR1 family protein
MENTKKIVFWGPATSGKTWLFRAFLKKVQLLNDILKSQGYSLDVKEINGNRWESIPNIDGLLTEATSDSMQSYYQIIRKTEKTSVSGIKTRVNTHSHEIWVFDNPGGWFQKQTQAEMKEDQKKQVAGVAEAIRNAHYLVLALDSGKTTTGESNFAEDLKQLTSLVANTEGKKIAACITKTDALGQQLVIPLYNRDESQLKGLLTRSFGQEYARQIDASLDILRRSHDVKLFATSAVGYHEKDGKKIVNLNETKTAIGNTAAWNPEEVEKPFFWLFDAIERQRIEYLDPASRLFSFLMGKDNILKTRREAYLSYTQLLRIAEAQPRK